MNISEVIQTLESYAPLSYAESYDNAGLLTGNVEEKCTGILCTLDITEAVIAEAVQKRCNLIVAHHPIIFSGLKKLTGKTYVERTVIAAIKNNVALYAIHTNIDNVYNGVSMRMAQMLGLQNCKVLSAKTDLLKKLYTFVPVADADAVRSALFTAGIGTIGNYTEVSFNSKGFGTYTPGENTNPYIGEKGIQAQTEEIKMEIIFPHFLQQKVISVLLQAHPYEEVAYDIISLDNKHPLVGSGIIGELPEAVSANIFLQQLATVFNLPVIKHTKLAEQNVKKIAMCGGAGFFLMKKAIAQKADVYITSDVKYHEFFDADGNIVLADIGHWESEQFTIDLLYDILQAKFRNFAVLKTDVITNPVQYFVNTKG